MARVYVNYVQFPPSHLTMRPILLDGGCAERGPDSPLPGGRDRHYAQVRALLSKYVSFALPDGILPAWDLAISTKISASRHIRSHPLLPKPRRSLTQQPRLPPVP